MYIQIRQAGKYKYVYVVEAYRTEDRKIAHRTIEKLGRYDVLYEKDPNFLEKLKESIKERGEILKADTQVLANDAFGTKAKSTKKASELTTGFSLYTYGNCVLRIIYRDYLKIDYRLSYVQKTRYPDLKFDLSEFFLHRIYDEILDYPPEANKRNIIADGYNKENEINEHLSLFISILQKELKELTSFISKKATEYSKMPWLHDLSSIFEISSSIDEIKNSDYVSADISKEQLRNEIELNKGYRGYTLLKDTLVKSFYTIIVYKLKDRGIKATLDDVSKALRTSFVVPYLPIAHNKDAVYLKLATDKVKLMDEILKCFDLTPLLNSQSGKEIAKRLKLRAFKDEELLGDE